MGDEMEANRFSRWAVAASAAMVFSFQAIGQQAAPAQITLAQTTPVQTSPQTAPAPKRVIVVSLEDRKLALLEDGQVKKVYTVAVGKPSTPSPAGTFTIERRVKNPVYRHDGKVVQPGPGNPVGTRWMGLSIKGYGIHGTNAPRSIGKAASHGCIRMGKADIEDLFEQVQVGDTVELIGERNDETAQLFSEPKPAPAEQPVVTASAEPAATTMLPATPTTTDATADGVAVTGNW
jgi:lipoprotein-anchoring transpeptidase ErfK/SrfK